MKLHIVNGIETNFGQAKGRTEYACKKLRFGWCVYRIQSGEMILTGIPSQLRAKYAVARLNGKVHNVFVFGDL